MAPKSTAKLAAKKEIPTPGFRLAFVRGGRRKRSVAKSVKAGLQFARIERYLKEGRYAKRISTGTLVYLAAVLEYLATEVLEITENRAKFKKRSRIIPRDLLIAIKSDEEVDKMLVGVTIAQGGVVPYIHFVLLPKKTTGKAAKSPKKTAGKAAKSPEKSAVKAAKSPEKTAVKAAKSHKKNAEKAAKSPKKTRESPKA